MVGEVQVVLAQGVRDPLGYPYQAGAVDIVTDGFAITSQVKPGADDWAIDNALGVNHVSSLSPSLRSGKL